MKRFTGTAALAGLAVAAAGCGSTNVGFATQHEDRAYEVAVGQLDRLDVRLDLADVEITGTDTTKIMVRERLRYSRKNKPTPFHKTVDDTLLLSYKCPSGLRVGFNVCDVDYRIEVPRNFAVKIASDSGDVSVRGTRGGLHADIDSGNLEAHELGGGAVTADIDSGRLEVTGAGNLTVKVDSGQVEASELTGPNAYVDADSGAVRLRFAAGSAPKSVITTVSSGSTRIWLPAVRGNYRISTQVDSGQVRVDDSLRGDNSQRTIRTTADSGSIHVLPLEAATPPPMPEMPTAPAEPVTPPEPGTPS